MNFQFFNFKNIPILFLLLTTFILPFLSMRNFSPAADEVTHLPSGYTYLKTSEIKLNPQHPPLIKMIAAVPLMFLDIKLDVNNKYFTGPEIKEWRFGQDFLYDNGMERLIFWGRIPMILISVLLGWYIYRWGRDLFGYSAGIIALFIYSLMPNTIAHSQLITTDMGVAAFSFISVYYLWRFTTKNSKADGLYSGLNLGLALASKFSAVFLLPAFLILFIFYSRDKFKNLPNIYKFNYLLKKILPIFGLAFLVLWALYFFTFDFGFYWNGLNSIYDDSSANYQYYLNGDFKDGGWWYYFLWAFIIKTPVPFLIVLALALVYYKKLNLSRINALFLFLPIVVFVFIISWKAHNFGIRYILPIYPFLILFVGGWISSLIKNEKLKIKNYSLKLKIFKFEFCPPAGGLIFAFLTFWYVYSAISVYPDYLAYFNEFIGGSNNGYKYLDDSNIDWGYDLKRLKEYQKEYPELKVAYVWDQYLDAQRFGIKNLESLNSEKLWLAPNGRYAVSTHAIIRTRLAGRINNNKQINWMDSYNPIDRIGQSFLIYEFP